MPRRKRRRPAGFGSCYERSPGNWWIKWRESGAIRYRHGYPTRELAERVLSKIVADIAAGRDGLPPDPKEIPLLKVLAERWIERRQKTHRSAEEDRYRWRKHLAPWFEHLRPDDVDAAYLRRFIEAKLGSLSSSTVRLCIAEVSSLFADLVEQGYARQNPVKTLPRSTRRLIRPAHDPRTTPFVERLEDIRRIFLALDHPVNIAFAVGALAGLRTGEVLALAWVHVDLVGGKIHVRHSTDGDGGIEGRLKDDESRVVPIQDALRPILAEAHLRTGGQGTVVPPVRRDGRHCDEHTLSKWLKKALKYLKLPSLTWYQATRHTFASQWVLAGGSIEKLREVMGHHSVVVTERYAHLRPELFGAAERGRIKVDLVAGKGVSGRVGYAVATGGGDLKEGDG